MSAPATLPAPLAQHPRIAQWIALDRDGEVGVLTGRVELGQGNLTAIAQLAAEELCVDFARVRITGADTGLTPNEGFTAGSLSMTAGGQSVRLAAAAARELLLAEAARLLQRGADTLEIRDGHVLADGMETDLTLWALAARVPLDVAAAPHARPLPAAARRRAPPPRADLAERIAGAPFVHDFAPAGMLHGRPIHPPSLGARLASLDTDALAARPGVLDVVRDGSFVGILAAREEDAIAAARWGAARAAWTRGAAPDTPPQAHIAASDEPAEQIETRGDPAAAGGRRFATTVSRPYLSHGSIGPSCAVARWDGDDLTVWTHAQGVYPLRDALAMVFGIDAARIRCIHMPGAGCYGHNGADDVALDAALLARAVPGRPVRVLWSRADEFGCAPLGPAMVTEAVAHVDGDGRLAAMRVAAMSAPHGNRPGRNGAPNLRAAAYLAQPFPVPRSADIPPAMGGGADRNAVPPYKVPNLAVTKKVVQDLPWRTSSLRGLGAFLNVYAIETLIDDIAAGLGADPVDYRLRHLDHDPRGAEVIRRAAAAAGWPGQPAERGARWAWALPATRTPPPGARWWWKPRSPRTCA